jgi:hypothetical protein
MAFKDASETIGGVVKPLTRTAVGNVTYGDAFSEANAAVGRLHSTSTQYVKDKIFDFVYNEVKADRWKHLSRLYVARTNEASAYTDLKNETTASPSGSPVYSAQAGFVLQFGDIVDLGADLAAIYGAANVDSCVVGTFVSAVADKSGFYNLIDGDPYTTEFQISGRASTAKAAANWLGGYFGPTDTAYAESKLLNQVVQVQSAVGSGAGYALMSFADGDTAIVAPAHTPQTALSTSVKQNGHYNAANSCTQTWGMSYVASNSLDFAGFSAAVGTLMTALALTG